MLLKCFKIISSVQELCRTFPRCSERLGNGSSSLSLPSPTTPRVGGPSSGSVAQRNWRGKVSHVHSTDTWQSSWGRVSWKYTNVYSFSGPFLGTAWWKTAYIYMMIWIRH